MDRVTFTAFIPLHSTHFHRTVNNYPRLLINDGKSTIGFSSIYPAETKKLQIMPAIPEVFVSDYNKNNGMIQSTAIKNTLTTLSNARENYIRINGTEGQHHSHINLISCSLDQADSFVKKSNIFAKVPMRLLPNSIFTGEIQAAAVKRDKVKGPITSCFITNVGANAFEELTKNITREKDGIWLNMDVNFHGVTFIYPDNHHINEDLQTLNFNLNTWMLENFCSAALMVKGEFITPISVDHVYLNQDEITPENKNWQVTLRRRFSAINVWFLLRIYGVEGLQKQISDKKQLAIEYKNEGIKRNNGFELVPKLKCSRLMEEPHESTKEILRKLQNASKIYFIGASRGNGLFRRFDGWDHLQ